MILVGFWLWLFGVWPLADPGHSIGDGPMVAVDLMLHSYGLWLMVRGWRQRKQRAMSPRPRTMGER